ncbi:MAG: T9SS type A sorting domain-containing protein, partial [Chitinophagaceae bacterium]
LFVSNGFNAYGIYDNTTWNFNTNWATAVNDVQAALQNMQVLANSQEVTIRLDAKSLSQAQFDLVSVNGQILAQTKQMVQAGQNTIQLPIGSLPNGMYYVRCIMNENRVAKPFIKK